MTPNESVSCPRCKREHTKPVKLDGYQQNSSYSKAGAFHSKTPIKLDGFRCLICGEEWLPNGQKQHNPIPPDDDWKRLYVAVASRDTDTASAVKLTDELWIELKVREHNHKIHVERLSKEPKPE